MWPSTLIEIGGMSKSNPFVMLMQFGENYAYKHANAVVSLPQYAKDYMKQHGLKEDKFCYIPNGIVKEEWDEGMKIPDEHYRVLKELKNKDSFIVGYFGGHALSNCLMPFLQAAERENSDKVQYVLVGDGVEKKSLMRYAEEKRLNNVHFLPPVDKRAIPDLTSYFDCTYIGAKDSPLYRFGACMNKMFDGMMAGKPVIFAINAPPTPVSQANCGIIIPPEDPEAINAAIRQLMNISPSERNEMGFKGKREILEKYTYQKLAQQFEELFR